MHYHLCDHIYIAQFQNELILLDTKKDKYTICFKEFSYTLLNLILEQKTILTEEFKFDLNSLGVTKTQYIQGFLDKNIIEEKETPYPFYIDLKNNSSGVSNIDWVLPLKKRKFYFNIHILEAFLQLIYINIYIKIKGLYSIIKLIKKYRNIELKYTIPSKKELEDLANIVNNACLLYPKRTKCLEWAITFVILALKRKWKCNLEIGVQNYPFVAHAWVECNEEVVMDSSKLRQGLAIILSEPFRKLKT